MKERDLLGLARALGDPSQGQPCVGITAGPATFRTATSRAYYAGHTAGSRFLRDVAGCEVPRTPQAHAIALQVLRSCSLWEINRTARYLGDLRELRNRADYDLADARVETRIVAQDAIGYAEAVLEILDPYLSGEQHLPHSVEQGLQREASRLVRSIRDRDE